MRQTIFAAMLLVAFAIAAPAQQSNASAVAGDAAPNMGRAPDKPNGIGRLDARVFDEQGNPVANAYVKLDSNRTDGFFCEAWNSTNAAGVAVLPPIHMGALKLTVKAKGYETQKLEVPTGSLGEPVRVTLLKKK